MAPPAGPERYRLQQWLNFIGTELHKAVYIPLLDQRAGGFEGPCARESGAETFRSRPYSDGRDSCRSNQRGRRISGHRRWVGRSRGIDLAESPAGTPSTASPLPARAWPEPSPMSGRLMRRSKRATRRRKEKAYAFSIFERAPSRRLGEGACPSFTICVAPRRSPSARRPTCPCHIRIVVSPCGSSRVSMRSQRIKVHPYCSRAAVAVARADVLCPHRRGEPVIGIVRPGDGLVNVGERRHRDHRPDHFAAEICPAEAHRRRPSTGTRSRRTLAALAAGCDLDVPSWAARSTTPATRSRCTDDISGRILFAGSSPRL